MAITDLIAQGGTNIPSPVDRYMQARGTVEQLRQNKLNEQAQRQTMAMNQRKMQMAEQQQMQETGIKYATYIAPLLKQISDLPEDQQQAAYSQVVPQLKQSASEMGLPAENVSPKWDGKKADMVVKNFYKPPEAPKSREVKRGDQIVTEEWVGGKWSEVGAGPRRQETITGTPEDWGAGTNSQAHKLAVERAGVQADLTKGIKTFEYIESLIASPTFIGGNMKDIASGLNSAASQVKQAIGKDENLRNSDGSINTDLLDFNNDANLSRFRKMAITGDAYDSAVVEMAYIVAKQRDPGGKITDKDFEYAIDIIGSSSDKRSLLNTIARKKERMVSDYNIEEKTLGQRIPGYQSRPYTVEKPKSTQTNNTKSAADKWLEEAGFQ